MRIVAILFLFAFVSAASADSDPNYIEEHRWWFKGLGGNYGIAQMQNQSDPDDAYTVFAFADHFYRAPFRITAVAAPMCVGAVIVLGAFFVYRWSRRRRVRNWGHI